MRVGIHCGPVHGVVIGTQQPHFTFLGDAVNIASRMESNGVPMRIHVRALSARSAPRAPRPGPDR